MEIDVLLIEKVILSALLGALIGYERERAAKPAGLRTHILLSMGATLFTILSYEAFPGSDPARIAANIITGIGFIGAGVIIQQERKVVGVTTAASLWITTAIGMAVGTGYYFLSIVASLISFIVLRLKFLEPSLE